MVKTRQLTGRDAHQYHTLCQEARKQPGFFYDTSPDEIPDRWLDGVVADPNYFVLGAFGEKDELIGLASVSRRSHQRWQHRASLHQVYANNNAGEVLTSLLNAAITATRNMGGLRQLDLEVVRTDTSLIKIAEQTGFAHYGDYPDAVRLDGIYHDQHLMTRRVG